MTATLTPESEHQQGDNPYWYLEGVEPSQVVQMMAESAEPTPDPWKGKSFAQPDGAISHPRSEAEEGIKHQLAENPPFFEKANTGEKKSFMRKALAAGKLALQTTINRIKPNRPTTADYTEWYNYKEPWPGRYKGTSDVAYRDMERAMDADPNKRGSMIAAAESQNQPTFNDLYRPTSTHDFGETEAQVENMIANQTFPREEVLVPELAHLSPRHDEPASREPTHEPKPAIDVHGRRTTNFM